MAGFGRKGIASTGSSGPARPAAATTAVKFDVTPKPWQMLFGFLFFGAAGAVLAGKVADPRGLIINGLIELSPGGADIFYGVLVATAALMSGAALLLLIKSFGAKMHVSLDNHAVTGPKFYASAGTVRIDFKSISNVDLQRVQNSEFLKITARDGRKIRVGQSNFRVASEWNQFLGELQRRMG